MKKGQTHFPYNGGTVNYTYDSMGRLYTGPAVVSAQYGPAGELLQLNAGQPLAETRTYNSRLQLTSLSSSIYGFSVINLEYRYDTSGHNNGQITSMMDNVTGEEVAYQYDSLRRLISAITTGPQWGLTFSYDGFGNRTAQTPVKGSAPSWQQAVDAATNHVVGWTYDANGNVTYYPGIGGVGYDIENRLINAGWQGYSPDNKRIFNYTNEYQWLQGSDTSVQFYDPNGQLLGVYWTARLGVDGDPDARQWTVVTQLHQYQYFGGKLTARDGFSVAQDRLGSVRTVLQSFPPAVESYYPYGEERATGFANDVMKFGTYIRDWSGFDYADQRYYDWRSGRFLTPDPYKAGSGSGDPATPQSWNRFAFALNDPTNLFDPHGLFACDPNSNPIGCDPPPQDPFSNPYMAGTVAEGDDERGDPHCGGQGYSFLPNGRPYCPAPVLAPPAQNPMSCSFSVDAAGVYGQQWPQHTAIEVNIGGGVIDYQAFPEPKAPSQNPLGLPPTMGGSWLNKEQSTTGVTGKVVDFESGPQWCALDAIIGSVFNSWQNGKTTYYAVSQNSNAFTSWVLSAAHISLPPSTVLWLLTFAPGWGYPLGQ